MFISIRDSWKQQGLERKSYILPNGDRIVVLRNINFWTWEIETPHSETEWRRIAFAKCNFTEMNDALDSAEEYVNTVFGGRAQHLYDTIGRWSNKTFGDEKQRGPIGPAWHLATEIICEGLGVDRQEFASFREDMQAKYADAVFDSLELIDVLILTMDCARRSGVTWCELVSGAVEKMKVNQRREYPMPTSDAISEHDRSKD